MPSEWAKNKARERFRETGMDLPPEGLDAAARVVGVFLDRVRNEVLEEAAAVCRPDFPDAVRRIRALKHTEDTSDG